MNLPITSLADKSLIPHNLSSLPCEELGCNRAYQFECAGMTDIGRRRAKNQDQFLIADFHKNLRVQQTSVPFDSHRLFGNSLGKLMLVADGMGGENAGEVASQLAIANVASFLMNSMHWLSHPTPDEVATFLKDLRSAASFTHQMVCRDAEDDPNHRGMGTTLTMAYLDWPMLYVLHVGDSRCYVLKDGNLRLVTKDQTLAQQLADQGFYGDEGVEASPFQNVLVSAIGTQGEMDAQVYRVQLQKNDRILLCSDGLNAHLADDEIADLLGLDQTPQDICQRFIDRANALGGRDNITAIVGFC